MSAGAAPWQSFLPVRLLELPAAGWNRSALGRARRFEAAVMVADVCGFTPLSEAMARGGAAGTERLSRTINEVFTPIVDLVHAHAGEVGLYVGDAVVAVFATAGDARACATAVHARPSARLALSIGLAGGGLASMVVGAEWRLEHVLIGGALARAAAAERRAGPGQTIADASLDAVPAERQTGSGQTVANASLVALPSRGDALRSPPPAERALVAPFVHPSVAARLGAGRDRLLAEHRRVTALFCRFEDLDADDPAAPARLQEVVATAVETVARFDGALLQVEAVDKGSTLKVAFGAPVAHEDDERRATACARALLELPALAGAAIGLGTGTVLCGLIGSETRREYTVLGDSVNVAARLMVAARPGQIAADETTRARAGDGWGWREVGPLRLRGRAGAVPAFEPTGDAADAPAASRPAIALVGRSLELRAGLEEIERAIAGAGGVLTVTGEAGIGKSRLLDELLAGARARGAEVIRGAGQAYGRDFAYGAWREAARTLFTPDDRGPAAATAAPDDGPPAAATAAPGNRPPPFDTAWLGERAPLAAPLLGVSLPDTALTAGLSPELRAQALRELVVARVRERQSATPLVLAFEDCHWLDAPSRDLLDRLAHEVPSLRVLLVLTTRATDGLPRASLSLELGGLGAGEVERLVRAKHAQAFPGDAPPAADVVEALVERSGGNPLFAEELVNLRRANDAAALPESLRAVVTARLDTLGESERAALRVASVVGRRFRPDWLWGSDPGLGGAEAVARTLGALASLDLVHAEEAEYAFKHAVIRDVAYDTLAVAAREHLHEAVARHVERTHDLALPEVLETLAHHYGHSADEDKQRVYLRRAGDTARASFANEAALRHYRRLLDLLAGGDALDAALDLGAVLQLTGDWPRAEKLFARTLKAAESAGLVPTAARARAALGGLLAFTGAYPRAVEALEQARASFAALGDDAQLAAVLERLAHTYFQQGEDEHATLCAREHAELARRLGDRAGESTAIETLALVLWHRGELEPALEQFEAALALATEAGHQIGVVHALNDLAGLLVTQGRPADAVERLREAYRQAREIGYRRFEGLIVGNAAELFRETGDDDQALACAGRSLEIGASLHDVIQVLHNAQLIAVVRGRQGDPGGADALLGRVIAAATASDNRRYLASALLHQARARRNLGQPEAAAKTAAEALRVARAIGQADTAADAEAFLRTRGDDEPPATTAAPGATTFLGDDGPPATTAAPGAMTFLGDDTARVPDLEDLVRRAGSALDALHTREPVK